MEQDFLLPGYVQKKLIKLTGFVDKNFFIREIQPASFVYYRANALDPALCARVIERFENDERKKQATVYPEILNTKVRRATDLDILNIPGWEDIRNSFHESFNVTFKQLATMLPMVGEMGMKFRGDSLFLQRSKPGEFYDWHYDFIPGAEHARHFSLVWYLNDVEEGGETEFKYQQISVKPKAGSLVVFPSNWTHVHRGNPPVSGVKYTATAWLNCSKG